MIYISVKTDHFPHHENPLKIKIIIIEYIIVITTKEMTSFPVIIGVIALIVTIITITITINRSL